MAEVDIIVRSKRTGRTVLAVEVKLGGQLQLACEQLRNYMKLVGCTTGFVIVGHKLALFAERYGQAPSGSIELIGEYDTSSVLSLNVPNGSGKDVGFQFERQVQGWLESLTDSTSVEQLPDDIKAAFREHVLPWVEVGEIHATGLRTQHTPRV